METISTNNTLDRNLIRSKKRKYLGENDRIYCSTPEEAKQVLDIYSVLRYRWAYSTKYELNYSTYKNKTVYLINGEYLMFSSLDYAIENNKNIIPAKEFINYYTTKDMEKRNIKVTLEQATEWYNSDNEALRALALTVFTKEELTLNMEYIRNNTPSCSYSFILPVAESKRAYALADLAILAKYFNKDWKKTPNNTGYCLSQYNTDSINDIMKKVRITTHITVMYPGVVYFKEKEDLIKAIKIMGDRIKDLFL